MDFRFNPELHAPGVYKVYVQVRGEDDGWADSGHLILSHEEWQALRNSIMLGKGDTFGVILREPDTWVSTL